MNCNPLRNHKWLLLAISVLLWCREAGAQGIRLHDAEKEELAKEASRNFNELTAKDANVFAAMLRNLEAVYLRNLGILRQRNQATLDTTINNLVVGRWATLLAGVREQQSKFLEEYRRTIQDVSKETEEITNQKDAIEKARRKLKESSKALEQQRQKLQKAPTALKQFEEAIQKLRATGSIHALADLKKLQNVPDALKELKSLVDGLPQATGLESVLLDLGLSMAKIELVRQNENLEYSEWLLAAAQDRLDRLEKIAGLGAETERITVCPPSGTMQEDLKSGEFGKIYEYIRPQEEPGCKNRFGGALTDEILVTVGRLAKNAQQEPINVEGLEYTRKLRNLMDVLARYASLVGYQHFLLEAEDIERATQQVRHSIRLSAINAKEHEVFIAHGLEGLAIYHQGGLKPDEIANLIRAAQTIATAVIAARVN